MKKMREYLQQFAAKTDLPSTVVAGLPQTVINGFHEAAIDLQCGLESYSNTQIVVAVSTGKVSVSGANLRIRLMKEKKIIVAGDIEKVEFLRNGT